MTEPLRDLYLWDVLHDASADPDAIVQALAQLEAAPASPLRALLSGALPALCHHHDQRVRAAAAAPLIPCDGPDSSAALAALLDDADGSVRSAAARAAALHGPLMASLALLHRKDDVRRAVLDAKVDLPWHIAATLLADDDAAALLRARWDRDASTPGIANGLIAARHYRLMPPDEVRRRLEALPWGEPTRTFAALRFAFSINEKEAEKAESITTALARPWKRESLNDVIDACALTPDGKLDDSCAWTQALLGALADGKLNAPEHRRVAIALLTKALTIGTGPPRVLALVFSACAGALGLALPDEDKRRGLAACADVVPLTVLGRAKLPALPKDLVLKDGALQLRVAAGAMRLVAADPYAALIAIEPEVAHIIKAIKTSPRDAAALLELPPQSAADRTAFEALVSQALLLDLPQRALGNLVLALPHQASAVLESVEKKRAGRSEECLVAVVEALAHVSTDDPHREARAQRAATTLAPRVRREALPRLIADVVTQPFEGGHIVAAALLRAAGHALAKAVVTGCRPSAEAALVRHLDEMPLSQRVERAYVQALRDTKNADAAAWVRVREEERRAPLVLEDESADALRMAPDSAVLDVAHDALTQAVSGLAAPLLDRASLPRDPIAAAGALCLEDPLHQGAALFQRLLTEDAPFLMRIDGVLLASTTRRELPLLATAWLAQHPQHSARFDLFVRRLGPAGVLEIACDLPAPLLAMKLANALVVVVKGWALHRPGWVERAANTQLSTLCALLVSGGAVARPAEAGTSRLDANATLVRAAAEIARLCGAHPAASGFRADMQDSMKKLNPIVDDEIADLLVPIVAVRRKSAAHDATPSAPSAPPPPPGRDAFDAALTAGETERALQIAVGPTHDHWLDPDRLARLGAQTDARRLALALATSPHPAAYTKAVYALDAALRTDARDAEVATALGAFLRAGEDRTHELRLFAVEALARAGIIEDFLWVRAIISEPPTDELRALLRDHEDDIANESWRRVLAAGRCDGYTINSALLNVLRNARLREERAAAIARHLLESPDLDSDDMTELFLWVKRARRLDDRRFDELRSAVRWGIRQGRKLLNKSIGVELVHDAWGYTKLGSPRVYVNPLPILRGERNGDAVVRGLLVHELGHQIYHSDARAKEVWNDAQKKKLHSLLNLVADEHLERNLRSVSDEYGDHLKNLASHAFQHASRDVNFDQLVDLLGPRTFAIATRLRLLPGKNAGSVRVDVGRVLREVAAAGGSFARFVRALRQGLGVRDADPKVKEALALFATRGFRASTMDELMALTLELQRIFGAEVELLSTVGLHEVMESEESDVLAEGLSPDELADLERRSKGQKSPPRGTPVFNKGEDERFETINDVVVLNHDPVEHRAVAAECKRSSHALRRTLEQLGLQAVIERRRLSGRALDRSGLASAITKRDPRILVRRTVTPAPDLFIGVVVDCSGSMARDGCMERGRVFATLICEAARGLPGIDVRVTGFTDSKLFDAGDEERCAAHALASDGGNNDAAGLWHASLLAKQSRRKHRLLVMISDGLPTECTLGSLKALVQRLERRGTRCAQVAVRPLAEHAFRHYVEILDDDVDAAARRFSRVVTRLIKSTI